MHLSPPQVDGRRRAALTSAALIALASGALQSAAPAALTRTVVVTGHATSSATAVVGEPGDYSFLVTSAAGVPARYDPCQAVHYRVNAAGAPASGGRDVAEALRRITAVTGITFVRDGRTDILPGDGRFTGWGSTQLIIGWATAAQRPALAGSIIGEGGLQATGRRELKIAHSYALLDAADLRRYPAGWGVGGVGAVYAHELGHAVGLGHAVSPPEVMYGRSSSSSTPTYQRGDRAGLELLGRTAGCLS